MPCVHRPMSNRSARFSNTLRRSFRRSSSSLFCTWIRVFAALGFYFFPAFSCHVGTCSRSLVDSLQGQRSAPPLGEWRSNSRITAILHSSIVYYEGDPRRNSIALLPTQYTSIPFLHHPRFCLCDYTRINCDADSPPSVLPSACRILGYLCFWSRPCFHGSLGASSRMRAPGTVPFQGLQQHRRDNNSLLSFGSIPQLEIYPRSASQSDQQHREGYRICAGYKSGVARGTRSSISKSTLCILGFDRRYADCQFDNSGGTSTGCVAQYVGSKNYPPHLHLSLYYMIPDSVGFLRRTPCPRHHMSQRLTWR